MDLPGGGPFGASESDLELVQCRALLGLGKDLVWECPGMVLDTTPKTRSQSTAADDSMQSSSAHTAS